MVYFTEADFEEAKKHRNKMLTLLFIFIGLYVVFAISMLIWYWTLPYQSSTITIVKLIHYIVTGLYVVFMFIFCGIPFKRVMRYYKKTKDLMTGHKETSNGTFVEYNEEEQEKDGVDFKSLIFLEWNEFKNDYFERKVLVFNEKPFPEIEENSYCEYITQGNVLIEYKVIEDKE